MDAQEFYDYFKNALSALGVEWSDKDKIQVSIEDGEVVFSFERQKYSVRIG